MGFLDFFKRKRELIALDPNSMTEQERNSSVLKENAYLKGIISRIKAEEGKKRESQKEVDEEKEKAKYLVNQQEKLNEKDVKPSSLLKILKYNQNKKNKKKIHFCTFDGEGDLGQVDDFAIQLDGAFGCVSSGKVVWASKDLHRVFYSIPGLNNMAKKGFIPLCVNSKGQYEPNIMAEEVPQIVRLSTGKFKVNRFNTKPLSEGLADKEEEIGELYGELEQTEATVSDQQKEIYDKDRELKLHRGRADNLQSELSMALYKVAEIEMANGLIVRQNMALTSLKEINEGLITSMEGLIEKWTGKIEEKFSKDIRESEWEELKSKLNWAKANMPQTIYQKPEPEPKPSILEGVRPAKP